MQKRIISMILCLSMLATALMVSVSAVADIDAEVGIGTASQSEDSVNIENNSSLHMLTPSSNGQYNFYFGDISESATITFFVRPGAAYAEHQDAYLYQLFDKNGTAVNALYSNAYGGNGTTLYMREPDRGYNYTNWNHDNGKNGIVKLKTEEWNRIDLVVDFENKTTTGYVNYTALHTVAFENSVTSFDHMTIPNVRNSWSYSQYKSMHMDNMIVRNGAKAPVKGDLPSHLTEKALESATDVIMCHTFNSTTNVTQGVIENPQKGDISNKVGNSGFCGISSNMGINLPTGVTPEYRGVQESRVDHKDDWTFNIRFVATINEIDDMSCLGFDINYKGKTETIVCENVYSTITGSQTTGIDIEYSALTDFGSNYIYAVTLKGLSSKAIYDFKITPFVCDKEWKKTVGETARVVYTNGLLTENSFDISAPVKADVGTVMNVDGDAIYNIYKNYIIKSGRNLQDIGFWARDWFNYYYKDSGISDMIYCLYTTVPSDRYEDKVDKYLKKTDNGVAVDNTDNLNYKASYEIYTKTNVDPYQVWFDQCRENGINPWISFRMNDVHGANEELGHDDFFYTAKANGWLIGNSRWGYWSTNPCTIGSRYWYAYAYNYAIPQVREHFLNIIDAQLDMYDPYGIELDWQRQIWCFPNDSLDNIQYMNIMLEEINKIVEKYEKKYGHEIKIAIRLNRDIDEAKYFGFDVRGFAKNDWVDIVIASPYYGATDNDMPIAEWVSELEADGVEIWAGLECDITTVGYWQTVGSLAGYTSQYLGQGATKMYLFNLFGYGGKMTSRVCASIEMARAAQRRAYIVTEANCTPYNVGFTQYDPLPMSIGENGSGSVTINHGDLIEANKTVIFIAASGPAAPQVTYNGADCQYLGISTGSTAHVSHPTYTANYLGTMYAYEVPVSAIVNAKSGTITITANGGAITVNYIELMN